MNFLKIQGNDKNYNFGIEAANNKFRIILLEGMNEIACRKETLNKLLKFCQIDSGYIFKGRLKLQMMEEKINVYFKEILVGFIHKSDFIIAFENNRS